MSILNFVLITFTDTPEANTVVSIVVSIDNSPNDVFLGPSDIPEHESVVSALDITRTPSITVFICFMVVNLVAGGIEQMDC